MSVLLVLAVLALTQSAPPDSAAPSLSEPAPDPLPPSETPKNFGRAVINCRVNALGKLENCKVVSEDPPNQKFGAAALKLSAYFTLKKTASQPGATIDIPIRFQLDDKGRPTQPGVAPMVENTGP